MNEAPTDWLATILAAAISLGSAGLGVVIRYAHIAQRATVDWSKLKYEIPTVIGMALVAVPISEYITSAFAVNHGVISAVCVLLGYLGPSAFGLLGSWITKGKNDDGSN